MVETWFLCCRRCFWFELNLGSFSLASNIYVKYWHFCPKFYFILFSQFLNHRWCYLTWFHQKIWEFFCEIYIYIYKPPRKNLQNPWPSAPSFWHGFWSFQAIFLLSMYPVDPQAQVYLPPGYYRIVQLIKRNLLNNFYFNFYTAYGGGGGGACTWLWIFISSSSSLSPSSSPICLLQVLQRLKHCTWMYPLSLFIHFKKHQTAQVPKLQSSNNLMKVYFINKLM